ncbi:MAG TPA: asparagine synthase C-terminal domain-containing protein, partial [Thermoleophilaceae bacterium]
TPMSAYRAVRKLPPAHTLVLEDGQPRLNRYWQLDYASKLDLSPAELGERIRAELQAAVRRRLVADVPLGAFLSGGIDSSAVVAAMAEASSGPVKTFSIGFEDERFDELEHARLIAERFGTDHTEFVVRPDGIELLPKLVRHYGEPFADSSAIPCFKLAELTRRHVTVALNGDGGDESFAGYMRYAGNVLGQRFERLPTPLRRAGSALGRRLPARGEMDSTLSRVRRLALAAELDAPSRYARSHACFDPAARDALYTPEFAALVGESSADEVIAGPWREASGSAPVDVMLEVDVRTYLPGDLLTKIDIATMAHSLEARSPFLDPSLMQLAASIPASLKLRGREKKVVLRDALRGWIPDSILDRPKQGFSVPLAGWLRGSLSGYAEELLLEGKARSRGWFEPETVRGLLERHGRGEDHSNRIWSLIVLETWMREVVESPGRAEPAVLAA